MLGGLPRKVSGRCGCPSQRPAARDLSDQTMPAPAQIFAAQAIIAAQGVEDGLAEFERKTPPLVGAILPLAAKVSGLVRGVMRLAGRRSCRHLCESLLGMAHTMGAA